MKQKYIASVSFGKDSLAMLLKLIEKKYPLDEVVFYDTGKEFQAIYDVRDSVLPLLEKQNHAHRIIPQKVL
jgi:3'-phosphoadenosine 5'-phosphosulfate sulfotransferase (PAPS reductase)/FAD synthetase